MPCAHELSAFLHELAAEFGEQPAVADARTTLSFAALDAAADAWATRLANAGCGAGAHVGLLSANSPQWLAVAFGTWRSGATLVPLSTFSTARELEQTLAHADVDLLIAQAQVGAHDYRRAFAGMTPLPRLRRVVWLGSDEVAIAAPPAFAAPAPEHIAAMLYTSGTTGAPKGVMLSHRAIMATVRPTAQRTGLSRGDRLLSSLPLFWVAGLVIRALPTLATGCTLVLMQTFSAEAALAALAQHPVTAIHLRPPQVGQLLAHPDFSPALVRRVHRGGGRVEWFRPFLDPEQARLITGYGMTETAGYATALSWEDPAGVRRAQLGMPLPGVELRIVGDDGRRCGPGEVGDVRVRGPGLFSGYYKQPAGTGLDSDGFFCTGDLGRVDADGVFHFVGRGKDLLRVKGINVSPVEVETVLGGAPGVDAVHVVGLPADALEQEIVALVVPKSPGDHAVVDTLRRLAADMLSHYKRPRFYLVIGRDEVPLGGTAKPQRGALARLAAARLQKVWPKDK